MDLNRPQDPVIRRTDDTDPRLDGAEAWAAAADDDVGGHHGDHRNSIPPLLPAWRFDDFCDRGVFDTLRFTLPRGIEPADVVFLVDDGFDPPPLSLRDRPPRELGGRLYRPVAVYRRREDGASVICRDREVAVEFSVPRVLFGGDNARVAEVSPQDLLRAVEVMTRRLLPRTTAAADRAGECWCARRLDLAVDFWSLRVDEYLRAYRLARWPAVRNSVRFVERSRYWQPARRRASRSLVMYHKSLELGLDDEVHHVGRVELRLRDAAARRRLSSVLRECPPGNGLAFRSRGVVRWYEVDYRLLHAFLQREVTRLELSARPPTPGARARRSGLVGRMSRFYAFYDQALPLGYAGSERAREAMRREALWLALDRLGPRLSEVCWPGVVGGEG